MQPGVDIRPSTLTISCHFLHFCSKWTVLHADIHTALLRLHCISPPFPTLSISVCHTLFNCHSFKNLTNRFDLSKLCGVMILQHFLCGFFLLLIFNILLCFKRYFSNYCIFIFSLYFLGTYFCLNNSKSFNNIIPHLILNNLQY